MLKLKLEMEIGMNLEQSVLSITSKVKVIKNNNTKIYCFPKFSNILTPKLYNLIDI